MNALTPIRKVRWQLYAGFVVTAANVLITLPGVPHWVIAASTTLVTFAAAYGVTPEGNEVTP